MPSRINARHSEVDAKNPDEVFVFNESIIPENTATCSVYKVSTSERLSKPTQQNTINFEQILLHGKHFVLPAPVDTDKSAWNDDAKSYYGKISAKHLQQIAEGTHVCVQCPASLTQAFAIETDVNYPQEQIQKRVQELELFLGIKLCYCRSTTGSSHHFHGYLSEAQPYKLVREVALKVAYQLDLDIDKVTPENSPKSGITAPFHGDYTVTTEDGKTTTPDFAVYDAHGIVSAHAVPANDFDYLQEVLANTPKHKRTRTASKNATTAAPDATETIHGESFIHDIPKEVRTALKAAHAKGLQSYLLKVRELAPRTKSYRQSLYLAVACDLIAFSFSGQQTKAEVKKILIGAGDTSEISRRLSAITNTYRNHKHGNKIVGFHNFNEGYTVLIQGYYSSTQKIGNRTKIDGVSAVKIARWQRFISVINEAAKAANIEIVLSDYRNIGEATAMTKDKALQTANELEKEGLLSKMTAPNKIGTYFKLLEGYEAYLIGFESKETATEESIQALRNKKSKHKEQRTKDRNKRQEYGKTQRKAKPPYNPPVSVSLKNNAQKHVTEAPAPAIAVPSDDSQNNVKPTSEIADGDYAAIPVDVAEDYAEGSAPLANSPP